MLEQILNNIAVGILNPIISLLFGLALLYFIWGVIKYIGNSDNPEDRKTGSKHMVAGIIGMFIMAGVYGIIAILKSTIGV